jgi:hypothetical protein
LSEKRSEEIEEREMNPDKAYEDAPSFRLHYISRGPWRIHTEMKDRLETGHVRSHFIRNLSTAIKGRAIDNSMRAEKVHYNSIFEQHIIDLINN